MGRVAQREERKGELSFFSLLREQVTVVCDSAWGDMTACAIDQKSNSTKAQLVEP